MTPEAMVASDFAASTGSERRARSTRLPLLLVALVLGAGGLRAAENRALEDARRAYLAARSDPAVAAVCGGTAEEAQVTLERAEREHRDGDQGEVSHLAYVAQQEVAQARQLASEKQWRARRRRALSATRDEVVHRSSSAMRSWPSSPR